MLRLQSPAARAAAGAELWRDGAVAAAVGSDAGAGGAAGGAAAGRQGLTTHPDDWRSATGVACTAAV